ncbi:MAG: TRAP transporter substrate-binding protein DctP [Thermodesulfobacteriota bacterium]
MGSLLRGCGWFSVMVLVVCLVAGPGFGAEYKAEYKMSVVVGPTMSWGKGAQMFADLVKEASKDKIKIKVYFAGKLFAGQQTNEFMLVRQGVADFALASTINWCPQVRQLNLFSLPFMFDTYAQLDAVKSGEPGKKILEEIRKGGVMFLAWGENGFREVTNRTRAVAKPEDLDGLKIRAVGSPIFKDIFQSLGANPVLMNWTDALTAFQQGTVDGQENPVTSIILPYKLGQFHKYMTVWHYTIDPLMFAVNEKLWKEFSDADRKIIQEAAEKAGKWQVEDSRAGLTGDMAALKEAQQSGMEVTVLTPEQRKAFKDKTKPVWDKWTNEIGKDLVESAIKAKESAK